MESENIKRNNAKQLSSEKEDQELTVDDIKAIYENGTPNNTTNIDANDEITVDDIKKIYEN